ncbi:MAG: DsbE family thiol:disulfide interchange protein [Hydrogenophaga sp.]|uniref:DsbE family thiol:disulfide interchange protein n=1 Tax=Hydrogenophaga crocea TaxID=2716225 RepID=A0A6G8IC52_9BURK|nr:MULTISPECIES: DsbE family thiol:disulfide interchange protein [Hydrogenophaga]MBL0943665.1 DsbE family thiol:disulfide interchange protein [Hydrogenophaga sp.]QIM50635.1 DsbE family thiol:disulfide interchange protein [Hydrogenophaga crocea]
MKRAWWPLAGFVLLLALLGAGLGLKPREVPSPLIGRPVPAFALATLEDPARTLGPGDLPRQPHLINVWASWCVACQSEHPLLVAFARDTGVPVVGLNHKDEPQAARRWLQRHGNPYRMSLLDPQGGFGIDLGVYGVPETYVVDARGVIVHKHVGMLTPEVLRDTIAPLLVHPDG